MDDLSIAKREIKRAKHRAAQKRYYGRNRTAIASQRKIGISTLPLHGQYYSTPQLAKFLGREVETVRKWQRAGIIPKGRYKKDRETFYTEAEVDIIISAFKLLGNPSGPYGFNRKITVNGQVYQFKRWVKESIIAMRRKEMFGG